MKRFHFAALAFILMPALFVPSCKEKGPVPVETVRFNPAEDMSGRKIALAGFDKDFPTDWSGYNYLVLVARTSTSQYMYLGMNTDSGYAEASVTFYASDGWIRTAIPLDYFRKRPAASHDMAATFNKKRPFAHIGLHGTQRELVGVDSIGIRMSMPVKDCRIDLADVYLTVEDPGDAYLGDKPVVDEFGQWNLGEFEGKVHSEEELRAEWAKEDAELAAFRDDTHSKYGGLLARKVKATGYFRVEKIDGKWWFVDPDGCLFLSNASTDIEPGGGGTVLNPLPGMYVEKAPEGFVAPADLRRTLGRIVRVQPAPEGQEDHVVWLTDWNLYRRHGAEDTERKANQLNIDRMKAWGMNTIGNWSSRALMDMDQVPFMTSLGGIGIQTGIYGMPDVYRDDFAAIVDEGVKRSTERYKDSRMLIGWFLGNEPTWSNRETLLCDYILEADDAMPMKQALLKHIGKNGDTPESRKAFAYQTFERFVRTVNKALKKYDPNHLNLGIRFGAGLPADEVLEICRKNFDVYSFNNYGIEANVRTMDRVSEVTGLPMIIGEYHFGSVDRSLGESVIKVTSPEQRAVAYRNYTEKAFSHPGLIGVCWFAWYDEPILGRGDGENYNTGLLDATDRPYPRMVEAVKASAARMYDIHGGKVAPFDQRPVRAGRNFVDAWSPK